jgi:hypothetical protein
VPCCRARKCYGSGCIGCSNDWEECEAEACADYEDVTDFTPWVNISRPDSQGWYEKRFTFQHSKPASVDQVTD